MEPSGLATFGVTKRLIKNFSPCFSTGEESETTMRGGVGSNCSALLHSKVSVGTRSDRGIGLDISDSKAADPPAFDESLFWLSPLRSVELFYHSHCGISEMGGLDNRRIVCWLACIASIYWIQPVTLDHVSLRSSMRLSYQNLDSSLSTAQTAFAWVIMKRHCYASVSFFRSKYKSNS